MDRRQLRGACADRIVLDGIQIMNNVLRQTKLLTDGIRKRFINADGYIKRRLRQSRWTWMDIHKTSHDDLRLLLEIMESWKLELWSLDVPDQVDGEHQLSTKRIQALHNLSEAEGSVRHHCKEPHTHRGILLVRLAAAEEALRGINIKANGSSSLPWRMNMIKGILRDHYES